MKNTLLLLCLLFSSLQLKAQIVTIPDANFKAYLVGNPAINTNNDSEIQVTEANNYTGLIYCLFLNITDLTGIEAFTSLTELYCGANSLTTLDLSSNTALTLLSCGSNQLTSLNVSSNTALTYLDCFSNPLGSIDVSNNLALTQFFCSQTQLTSIDVSNNTALQSFGCHFNSISTLDLSNNTSLVTLNCFTNQLTNLDISGNPALTHLDCRNNLLVDLNVANGNNLNFTTYNSLNNPNLFCVQVDDAVWSTSNWTNVDAQVVFNGNCSCIVTIPDANFKANLLANNAINTNGDSEIQCDEASVFTGSISCSNSSIADYTGLEAFTSLTSLTCSNNPATSLDISQNTVLTYLYCDGNPIGTLDVTANTALTSLYCQNNNLTTLDLSQNAQLTQLSCPNNSITTLDFTGNPLLETMTCHGNLLTTLDMSPCPALTILECFNNDLSSLNVSSNMNLFLLYCYGNEFVSLDLSPNYAITQLACGGNPLTSLDFATGNNTSVTDFYTTYTPNLTCIKVDDANYSTINWTFVDPANSFSECCLGTPSTYTDVQNSCAPTFTWMDGITYSSPNNSATWTIANAVGCDSVITLDLSFNTPASSIDAIVSCIPITWIDGNVYSTSNSTATHTLQTVGGCDSVVTLDLTIGPYTYATNDNVTACNSYTWIDGITYTSSNNTATYLYTSMEGCDSTIYLILNIINIDNTVTANGATLTANQSNANYQWVDCNNGNAPISGATNQQFVATQDGDYACIISEGTCSETTACQTVSFAGMNQLELNSVSIYPNPTKHFLNLTTATPIQEVVIYDVRGVLVQTESSPSFSVEHLANGSYLLQVKTENGISIVRFVKE